MKSRILIVNYLKLKQIKKFDMDSYRTFCYALLQQSDKYIKLLVINVKILGERHGT